MKYDIAKNEDGPLRRTMKAGVLLAVDSTTSVKDDPNGVVRPAEDYPSAERYPALDERLQNVEKHFAVRYGRSFVIRPCRTTKRTVHCSSLHPTVAS